MKDDTLFYDTGDALMGQIQRIDAILSKEGLGGNKSERASLIAQKANLLSEYRKIKQERIRQRRADDNRPLYQLAALFKENHAATVNMLGVLNDLLQEFRIVRRHLEFLKK